MTCNTNAAEQEIFHGGASQIAPIPRRRNDAIQIVFRIRPRWYGDILDRNSSAIALFGLALDRRVRLPPLGDGCPRSLARPAAR
jgi:hypothetical protein